MHFSLLAKAGDGQMLWAARQLLTPVNYLRIRHGKGLFHSKVAYDFTLPIILAALTCLTFAGLGVGLAILSQPELMKRLTDLLTLLIAFYMAALAAVATFDRKGIDDPLKGQDATLRVRHHDGGHYVTKVLTYRQFISYLFGYLAFLSLALDIFLALFAVGWPKLKENFANNEAVYWSLVTFGDPVVFYGTFFFMWQLIITSLLGIYFLTHRIQSLSDPEN